MTLALSERTRDLHASPIREILAVIDRPGMISFAGGLPAAETFPDLDAGTMPHRYLQYGPSEGEPLLRDRVADELRSLGLRCDASQVLILSGSQQGIDLAAKLCIDRGTGVAVQSPTYLAALQVFRFFGARFVTFDPGNGTGHNLRAAGVRIVYVNPTFQNPTGTCLTLTERERVAHSCAEAGAILFEDDPYRDLVYESCERRPICSLMEGGTWIYQGSFSKSLAPGLRLGFLAASAELIPLLTRLKQAADLHSNRLSQWLVLQQLERPDRSQRMARLVEVYRGKRDTFDTALATHMEGFAQWRKPPGGLFFWLQLHEGIDTRQRLAEAVARNVAYMPGESFFADPAEGLGTLRLNFSHASERAMFDGLRTLAKLLGE